MIKIGIDIGSTATKIAIMEEEILKEYFVVPSGWNSVETSYEIKERLENSGYNLLESKIVATGYGRVSVPFANKTITEITCHSKGAQYLSKLNNMVIIDIGGQDTKIIEVENGAVNNFIMNDKCSAGTGRFIEVMANGMGLKLDELYEYASKGQEVHISSMCTVFAESEIISLVSSGVSKEDIANGVISSVIKKVSGIVKKMKEPEEYFLSGGLCENEYFIEKLSLALGKQVNTSPLGRYAGAIGAALLCK